MTQKAIDQIKSDEGLRLKAYLDTEKVLTIGYGFNLTRDDAKETLIDVGVSPQEVDSVMKVGGASLTKDQANAIFDKTLAEATTTAKNFVSNFQQLPADIKGVLVNMSFQLGSRLSTFKKMRAALEKGDFVTAGKEMLNSKWAKQTPNRAKRLFKTVSSVENLEQPPKSALGQKITAKRKYEEDVFEQGVRSIQNYLSDDFMINKLADSIKTITAKEKVEEATPEAKPILQKLERGLFEDEAGKKFFVDDNDRLLELGEDNQPKAVIDPSKFDLSKVTDTPASEEQKTLEELF